MDTAASERITQLNLEGEGTGQSHKDRQPVFSKTVGAVSEGRRENINFRDPLNRMVHVRKTGDLMGKEWR